MAATVSSEAGKASISYGHGHGMSAPYTVNLALTAKSFVAGDHCRGSDEPDDHGAKRRARFLAGLALDQQQIAHPIMAD
jgi:hypothetical protein